MSHPGVKSVIFFFLGECVNHYITSFSAYFHNTNLSKKADKSSIKILQCTDHKTVLERFSHQIELQIEVAPVLNKVRSITVQILSYIQKTEMENMSNKIRKIMWCSFT